MSSDKIKSITLKLTENQKKALQILALAGWVKDPEEFSNRTQVGVIRKALRDAWQACPQTKDKPFPGEENL
jgi:hypothetical protein